MQKWTLTRIPHDEKMEGDVNLLLGMTIGQCRRCEKRRNVVMREWGKASSPKCFECGGQLDRIPYGDDQPAEQVTAKKNQRERLEKAQGHLVKNARRIGRGKGHAR